MYSNLPPPNTENRQLENPYWGFWPTVGFGLAIGAAYLFVSVLIGIAFAVAILLSDRHLSVAGVTDALNGKLGLFSSVGEFFTAVAAVGLIAIFIRAKKTISIRQYLGLGKVNWRSLLGALGIALALLVLSGGLGLLLKRPQSQFDINLYKTSVWPPLLWAALIVFAPLFEETLFRGFLFEGFLHSRMGAALTIIITALVWSSLHIQYDLFDMANIFVLGLVLGAVRLRTGSLWNTMAMHAMWNLVATIQIAVTLAGH